MFEANPFWVLRKSVEFSTRNCVNFVMLSNRYYSFMCGEYESFPIFVGKFIGKSNVFICWCWHHIKIYSDVCEWACELEIGMEKLITMSKWSNMLVYDASGNVNEKAFLYIENCESMSEWVSEWVYYLYFDCVFSFSDIPMSKMIMFDDLTWTEWGSEFKRGHAHRSSVEPKHINSLTLHWTLQHCNQTDMQSSDNLFERAQIHTLTLQK